MGNRKISVDISEAYRYLGGNGFPEQSVENELGHAAGLVDEAVRPRSVIRYCEIERSGFIMLKGTNLRLEGKSISALLHDCDTCVIFCATIGSGIDALIRKWQLKDIAFAAMLDACASSAVESLCNQLEAEIKKEASLQGYYITDRFSPGYGDLPLAIQPNFCAELDTQRKIGVVVGDNLMMTPQKSVTAIIGLSNNPQRHFNIGCRDCDLMKSCRFRENGVTCYGRVI